MTSRFAPGRLLAAAAALVALAGCPLPQPTPGVGQVPGRTFTPPRIVTGSVKPVETIVDYDPVVANCPASVTGGTSDGALFKVSATVADEITTDTVVARWFVDYDAANPVSGDCRMQSVLPPPTDPTEVLRPLLPYTFQPAVFDVPGARIHVVEVVIAVAFAAECNNGQGKSTREPAEGYETQLFRWIFNPVATGGLCTNPP